MIKNVKKILIYFKAMKKSLKYTQKLSLLKDLSQQSLNVFFRKPVFLI